MKKYMRIRCRHCKIVLELGGEHREIYARIVREDNLTVKEYLALINIAFKRKGECTNQDGHDYVIEETYQGEIDQVLNLYKTNVISRDADKRSLEQNLKSIEELEAMIVESKEKNIELEANIKSSEENIEHAEKTIPKMSGIELSAWLVEKE
jgi:hypothetical protein